MPAVGSAKEISIPVSNPLDENLMLHASYGSSALLGPKTLQLEPRETQNFIFYFAPLMAGKFVSSAKLKSEVVGEFWYEVHMEALATGPIRLPSLQAPLGSSVTQTVLFINPGDTAASFQISCSSKANFTVSPERTQLLQPQETTELTISYEPQSFHKQENCGIICSSEVRNLNAVMGVALLSIRRVACPAFQYGNGRTIMPFVTFRKRHHHLGAPCCV
jgi:hypothetical protein